jgi:DNA mismatch endonuclease (patch repair protein)
MSDFLTKSQRSQLMSRIRGKNTGIELAMFRQLRRLGLRFQKHRRDLPGSPDIVVREAKLAVFVDGDFWHGRDFPEWQGKLAPEWKRKIAANISRDRIQRGRLRRMGWSVMRIWGKDVRTRLDYCCRRVIRAITASPHDYGTVNAQ